MDTAIKREYFIPTEPLLHFRSANHGFEKSNSAAHIKRRDLHKSALNITADQTLQAIVGETKFKGEKSYKTYI